MGKAIVLSIVIPVLVVGAIAGAFFVWVLSNRASIFQMRSGSMRPALQIGDFVLANPKASNDINAAPKPEGDIIVFRSPRTEEELICHRAVGKTQHGGVWFFETEGDANGVKDTWTGPDTWQGMISERLLEGVVIAKVPRVWLILFGVILLLMVILQPVMVSFYLRTRHPGVSKSRTPPPPPPETLINIYTCICKKT